MVEIRDGVVRWCGPEEDYPGPAPRHSLDAGGGLILPGLVNAHCHGAMVLFRGLADDLPLLEWLTEHIFPAEARWVNEEMVETCTLLAAGEMLLSGTTCVGEAYFCASGAARAYARAGMRAVVAQGVIDFPAPGVPRPEEALEVARGFLEQWQGADPLITPALFAHSPYTCSPETLAGVADLAREKGVAWFTHLAETAQEVEEVRSRYGATPGRHLESLGLLESLRAAVHGVWLDAQEVMLLARRGVALVHCPESNLKLASGLGRLAEWLAAGVTVGLGTDGPASNNDLDLWGELATAARLAKVAAHDPAVVPAAQALEMAWGGSARALGLEGVVGRLRPGWAGDLVVLNLAQPHLTPLHNIASALVYSARGGDVRHVVVRGRLVVRDRQVLTFDLPAVMERVQRMARRVARP
jgi:5-methylthioadenosine/S-adenosylhomocysteine deaminase